MAKDVFSTGDLCSTEEWGWVRGQERQAVVAAVVTKKKMMEERGRRVLLENVVPESASEIALDQMEQRPRNSLFALAQISAIRSLRFRSLNQCPKHWKKTSSHFASKIGPHLHPGIVCGSQNGRKPPRNADAMGGGVAHLPRGLRSWGLVLPCSR